MKIKVQQMTFRQKIKKRKRRKCSVDDAVIMTYCFVFLNIIKAAFQLNLVAVETFR
jgi:hypothetical protein